MTDQKFVFTWNGQLSVSIPVLFTLLCSRSFQLIWFPGDNVTIYLGVDGGGWKVAVVIAVIVGLSFAMKIPPGKKKWIHHCPVTTSQEPQYINTKPEDLP